MLGDLLAFFRKRDPDLLGANGIDVVIKLKHRFLPIFC
jgi:hypothetical protein